MNSKKMYSLLGWLAMIAVPIAPAFYFGFDTGIDVYERAMQHTDAAWAMLAGVAVGTVGALGLELVGILAGHTAVSFWSRRNYGGAALGGAILMTYVALGISGLEHALQKGVVMFLIAPLVYLLVAMQNALGDQAQRETEQEVARAAFDLEQEAKDREMARLLKLRNQEANAAVKLAKTEAGKRRDGRVDVAASNGHLPGDFRLLTEQQKEQIINFSTSELEQAADISASTARRWKRKVSANGHV
jgi:hypothetical protein